MTTEDGSSVVVVLGISSTSPWFNLLYPQYPVYMSVVLCRYGILSTISQLQKEFLAPMVPKIIKEEGQTPPPPPPPLRPTAPGPTVTTPDHTTTALQSHALPLTRDALERRTGGGGGGTRGGGSEGGGGLTLLLDNLWHHRRQKFLLQL